MQRRSFAVAAASSPSDCCDDGDIPATVAVDFGLAGFDNLGWHDPEDCGIEYSFHSEV
jgi:hypothetical protein